MNSLTAALTLAITYASLTTAALCSPKGLAGIGDSVQSFPPDYQFILLARNSSGSLFGVNASSTTGDYAPLVLADSTASIIGFPRFELVNGNLRTFDKPYRYVTTKGNPLVQEMQVFTSPEGVGNKVSVVANNVSCGFFDSMYAIRYQGLVPGLSTGSGATNGTFQEGATLTSPILAPVAPVSLMRPIDMILKFF